MQQTLKKLQAEIAVDPQNDYVRYIGAELIRFVQSNPDKAVLFEAADKSIKGSLDKMRQVASAKKTGNMAVLTPAEGMAVVLEYYGIQQHKAAQEPVAVGFAVDLDDL